MYDVMFSLLLASTPVWLSLCLIAACAGVAWQFWALRRRVDRHARSIAHMDEWADTVDHKLQQIEDRSWRLPPSAGAHRTAAVAPKWWQT